MSEDKLKDEEKLKEILEKREKRAETRKENPLPIPLVKHIAIENADKKMVKKALTTCGKVADTGDKSHWVGVVVMAGDEKKRPVSVIARAVDEGVKIKIYCRHEEIDKEEVMKRVEDALTSDGADAKTEESAENTDAAETEEVSEDEDAEKTVEEAEKAEAKAEPEEVA